MDRKILEMLEADGRLTAKQIALMLDKEEGEIRDMIEKFENEGVILGYKAIVDWDKTDREYATALIELKVRRSTTAALTRSPNASTTTPRCRAST